jgi:DNA polymerase
MAEVREELSALVAAFRTHLGWRQAHGARWFPCAPSPRVGPSPSAAEPDTASPEAAEESNREAAGPAPSGPLPAREALERVRQELGECKRCGLSRQRKKIVFGEGSPSADLMFVGEAPGGEEDQQGRPFVGAAGQLLTRMIEAMGLSRDEVYICNIIKCRPPRNRDPNPDEIETCEPFLRDQIDAIGPSIIIALGSFAARTLLRTETSITRLRGRFHTYHGIALMPTFHPAYLLRNAEQKRPVWQDLKAVMAEMDRLGLHRRR